MRKRFTREHLVAHGGVVDESGFDERGLGQVFGLQAFVGVHVRMMCARGIVERVLDELKAGEADGVESFVIGAASVAERKSRDAEIFEGSHPLLENGSDGGVALEVDAANFSSAIIDIEIRGEFLVVGLKLNRAGGIAVKFGDIHLLWIGGARNKPEMLLDVIVGAELTLFLTSPQTDTNRAA